VSASVAIFSHPVCAEHDMGPRHPEQPARLAHILQRLEESGLGQACLRREAPTAPASALARAHSAEYLAHVTASVPATGLYPLDADTALCPASGEASLRAAGAAVAAVDDIASGSYRRAFCAVRPPGHHAVRDHAMGFCVYNSLAIAALHALEVHGLERVAIVDFDVHHGNGTEDIVQGDERILFLSTFQHPHYPFSGTGQTAENVINTPLPAGTPGSRFREVIEREWLGRLQGFAPDMLFISAGFDAHREDPLGGLELTEEDYSWVTRELCGIADAGGARGVISGLEGGYALDALARSAEAHVAALLE
jgi:acetoin utilization deacetylase AcuC-like enzyme